MIQLIGIIAWLAFWAVVSFYAIVIMIGASILFIVIPIMDLFFKKSVDEVTKKEV
jgi:hypothetical protein